MSKIGGKEIKPETIVRNFLFANGFRYRKNDNRLPGRPDIVLPKYGTVMFVNGCFWHGHENCKAGAPPKTRTDFWVKKISENKERDRRDIETLGAMGWKVIELWQCEIKTKSKREKRLGLLISEITDAI